MLIPQAPEDIETAAAVVGIELLDLPCLLATDRRRVPLERKAAALLALLALDGARPRAEIAALLWPDAAPPQARNSLRQRIFRLQRAAGREIVAGHDELRLSDGIESDLQHARERLAADPHARAGELLGALDYADAPALADWVDRARERWRGQRSAWLAEFASGHETRHEVAQALSYARRLVAEEPLQEHGHRRLMRLHYLRGDRSAALAAFEHCRALLRAELDTPPDRETTALAQQIAAGSLPATRPSAPPVAVLRPPRVVGREAERARLATAIDERRVLLLRGEPGIGKSRLLDDAAEGRDDLLTTAAHAGESRLAYALLARIATLAHARFEAPLADWVRAELARLLPQFGDAPTARLDPLRLQQAVATAWQGWTAQGLAGLLVDDLHHADDASLECLLALAVAPRETGRAQPAWIFSARDAEMPAAVRAWLQTADGATELRVGALDVGAVTTLLGDLALAAFTPATWGRPLRAHSGGNPLFALETVRAMLALGTPPAADERLPVPAALGSLLERRLARLSAPALRLARIAALAGGDFDADLAAEVLEVHPLDLVGPWRDLEAAEILAGGRFSHDLIAEAAIAALPDEIACALHARLAAALQTLARSAARIAPHWARAESWSQAGDSFALAAREAQRASRRVDEVALWQQAADNFDRAGQFGMAFDARGDSVESVIVVAGLQAAQALVDRLDADARTEPQRLRALIARAMVRLFAGDQAGGESAARAALESATQLGALWPRFEAARLLAVALSQAFRASEALAVIEPFRAIVEAQGDAEQRHHFWSDYAYVLKAVQRLRDCADALEKSIAGAQLIGDHAEIATQTSNLAVVVSNFGRPQESLAHGQRARALLEPLGQAGGPAAGAVDLYIAVANMALGRYADALTDFDRAAACFERNDAAIWIALVANHRAAMLIQLGQYARAKQALDYSVAATPAMQARRELLRARIARALGHGDASTVEAAIITLGSQGDHLVRMLLRLEATLALPPLDAAAACDDVRREAEAIDHSAVAMRARVLRLGHLQRGDALASDPGEATALTSLLDAVQPADTYLPEAWWIVTKAHDAQGDTAAAHAALTRAFEWVVQGALPQVPAAFRDSFLNRNASNLALLAAAGRRLGQRVPSPLGTSAG